MVKEEEIGAETGARASARVPRGSVARPSRVFLIYCDTKENKRLLAVYVCTTVLTLLPLNMSIFLSSLQKTRVKLATFKQVSWL